MSLAPMSPRRWQRWTMSTMLRPCTRSGSHWRLWRMASLGLHPAVLTEVGESFIFCRKEECLHFSESCLLGYSYVCNSSYSSDDRTAMCPMQQEKTWLNINILKSNSFIFWFKDEYFFEVKVDGSRQMNVKNDKPLQFRDVRVFMGDEYHSRANARIKNLEVNSEGTGCLFR